MTGIVLRLNSGGRHQMAHVTPFLGGGGGGVPSVRLDEVVASDPRSEVLMLKIDVEGHEVHALRGALGLLRRRVVRWVTMEAGEAARWARANVSAEDMVGVLREVSLAGYGLWVIRMWQQPSTRFVQSSTSPGAPQLLSWPRRCNARPLCVSFGPSCSALGGRLVPTVASRHTPRLITTGRAAPADLSVTGCPPAWCVRDAAGRTLGAEEATARGGVELLRVPMEDLHAFVHGPMSACDWNLFFERESLL